MEQGQNLRKPEIDDDAPTSASTENPEAGGDGPGRPTEPNLAASGLRC